MTCLLSRHTPVPSPDRKISDFGQSKTKNGRRTILLGQETMTRLRARQKRQELERKLASDLNGINGRKMD